MDVSTRIVGQNCNHYVFSKIVAIFVSFKHYCCKKQPLRPCRCDNSKPKKGPKRPHFLGMGGSNPPPLEMGMDMVGGTSH